MKTKYLLSLIIFFNAYAQANWKEKVRHAFTFFSWEGQLLWSVRFARKKYINWLCTKVDNINVRDRHERTPLIIATQSNRRGIVMVLIDQGASTNLHDKEGNTALHHARFEVACDLIEKQPDINLNIQNNNNQLPQETIYDCRARKICTTDEPPQYLNKDAHYKKNFLVETKKRKRNITREDILEWEDQVSRQIDTSIQWGYTRDE